MFLYESVYQYTTHLSQPSDKSPHSCMWSPYFPGCNPLKEPSITQTSSLDWKIESHRKIFFIFYHNWFFAIYFVITNNYLVLLQQNTKENCHLPAGTSIPHIFFCPFSISTQLPQGVVVIILKIIKKYFMGFENRFLDHLKINIVPNITLENF